MGLRPINPPINPPRNPRHGVGMTSNNSLALEVVEQGAGGDEDARPLLEGALHLGKEVVVETLQALTHRTLVLLGEASREVDQRLYWHLEKDVRCHQI